MKFDFHATTSSTLSNVSSVLRCEQQCCIRSAITFNSVARTHALRLSVSMVLAYSLYLFRALPRQFKLRMLNDQSQRQKLKQSLFEKIALLVFKALRGGRQCICRIFCKSRPRDATPYAVTPWVFSRFLTPAWCKTFGDRAFAVAVPRFWNSRPLAITQSDSIDNFKGNLKTPTWREFVF